MPRYFSLVIITAFLLILSHSCSISLDKKLLGKKSKQKDSSNQSEVQTPEETDKKQGKVPSPEDNNPQADGNTTTTEDNSTPTTGDTQANEDGKLKWDNLCDNKTWSYTFKGNTNFSGSIAVPLINKLDYKVDMELDLSYSIEDGVYISDPNATINSASPAIAKDLLDRFMQGYLKKISYDFPSQEQLFGLRKLDEWKDIECMIIPVKESTSGEKTIKYEPAAPNFFIPWGDLETLKEQLAKGRKFSVTATANTYQNEGIFPLLKDGGAAIKELYNKPIKGSFTITTFTPTAAEGGDFGYSIKPEFGSWAANILLAPYKELRIVWDTKKNEVLRATQIVTTMDGSPDVEIIALPKDH